MKKVLMLADGKTESVNDEYAMRLVEQGKAEIIAEAPEKAPVKAAKPEAKAEAKAEKPAGTTGGKKK